MFKLKTTLLAACLLFEVADFATTSFILNHGGGKSNPLMALAQTWLGGWWIVPKLGLALVMIWLLSLSKKPRHIAYVMVLISVPVYNNLIIIGSLN